MLDILANEANLYSGPIKVLQSHVEGQLFCLEEPVYKYLEEFGGRSIVDHHMTYNDVVNLLF